MRIAIIGFGAWGKALAKLLDKKNNSLLIWSRNKIDIDINAKTTTDINALQTSDIIIIAVPAQSVRQVCKKIAIISKKIPIIIASKGIECATLCLLSEVIAEELMHDNVAIVSGPNFAHEIQANLPCSATLSCIDPKLFNALIKCFNQNSISLKQHNDIIGTQIYGALKNVIAIYCGIFYAKKLGNNATAALITAGLNEITTLSVAKGGKISTAFTLSGIGDLILTCSSLNSRNVSCGVKLVQGYSTEKLLTEKNTIEGLYTTKSAYQLAQKLKLKMPIVQSIYNIIYKKDCNIDNEIKKVLSII